MKLSKLFQILREHPFWLSPKSILLVCGSFALLLIFNFFFSGLLIGLLWVLVIISALGVLGGLNEGEGAGTSFLATIVFATILYFYSNYLSELNYFLIAMVFLPLPLLLYMLKVNKYYLIMEVNTFAKSMNDYSYQVMEDALRFYRKQEVWEVIDEFYSYINSTRLGKEIESIWEDVSEVLRSKRRYFNSGIDRELTNKYIQINEEAADLIEKIVVKLLYYNLLSGADKKSVDDIKEQLKDMRITLEEMKKTFAEISLSQTAGVEFLESIEAYSIKTKAVKEAISYLKQ